ncbi:hypothetical protein [Methanococcoides sp. LMO-2]|uniref:Uncharacterized protein n=1 Tax=Methanococcoides cohabitans TaxID=3136559 RepID=A0ABU9KXU1_9EURY
MQQTTLVDSPEVSIWMEQEPGSSGVSVISHFFRHVLTVFSFRSLKFTGNKVVRAGLISAAAANRNVKLV